MCILHKIGSKEAQFCIMCQNEQVEPEEPEVFCIKCGELILGDNESLCQNCENQEI